MDNFLFFLLKNKAGFGPLPDHLDYIRGNDLPAWLCV